jgi:hypothetical protein
MRGFSVVVCVVIFQAVVTAQDYSAADITTAISFGTKKDVNRIQSSCSARISGFWNKLGEADGIREYEILGQSPLARVADFAEGAKARYQPIPTAEDDHILEILSDNIFTVWAVPDAGGSMTTAARLADTGVEHVVIRPRGDKQGRATVQPLTVDVAGVDTVSNLFGMSVQLEGIVATFASDDVINIVKIRDVEVILITTSGEFKCNLDYKRIMRGYRTPLR